MNFISLSSILTTPLGEIVASDDYADEARCVLPIDASLSSSQIYVDSNVIVFDKKKYIYRAVDLINTGVFPTLNISLLSTVYDNANPCYFNFEVEWTTSSAVASYPSAYEFLNYPDIQTNGSFWTYYITCRVDVISNKILLICWRMKEITT